MSCGPRGPGRPPRRARPTAAVVSVSFSFSFSFSVCLWALGALSLGAGALACGNIGDGVDPALLFCVDEHNRYRTAAGLDGLERDLRLEAFAAEGAEVDAKAGDPGKHFEETNGGGVAVAENRISGFSLSDYGGAVDVIREGMELMVAEGPGGDRYDAIHGAYRYLGCGIFVLGDEMTINMSYGR